MVEVVEGQKGKEYCEFCKKPVPVTYRIEDYKTEFNDTIPAVMQSFCDLCNTRSNVPHQASHLIIPYYRKKVEDSRREEGLKMKCPICRTSLIITGQEQLESMYEHITNSEVSFKDAFGCPIITCEAYKDKIVWDHYGDMFGSSYRKEYHFVGGNYGPFGSERRAREACDLYKKSHTKHIEFRKIDIEIYPECEADNNGKILKKKWRSNLWINRILYISGIRMFIFSIKSFYRGRKWENQRELKKHFEPFGRNDEWWRIASRQYFRIVHRKMYKNLFPDPDIDIKKILRKYS